MEVNWKMNRFYINILKLITFIFLFAIIAITNVPSEELFQIGVSSTGQNIYCYSFGSGEKCIIVVGGIHGRYEENTILLANRLIDYFQMQRTLPNVNIKIIANLNPDSLRYELDDPVVLTDGSLIRYNGNSVDLNRNWDTPNWQRDCVYSLDDVRVESGGREPMSEPEVKSLSNLLINCRDSFNELYVIVLHSYVVNKQEINHVFPSYVINENDSIEITEHGNKLADIFSSNGNFTRLDVFPFYEITGELINWCGINGIAAIDIEFGDNGDIDFMQNNGKSHWENFLESFKYLLENIN